MNTLALIPQTYSTLILFFLMMTRVGFLFSTFVLFRRDYVNAKIIISLSAILALYALVLTKTPAPVYEFFSIQMGLSVLNQAFIGFICGLILNIIMEIFTSVGQILSTQIGFSMVTLIDPRFGAITPLTKFYNYVAILIFLLLDGHLITIKIILDSFTSIPVDSIFFPINKISGVVYFANNIFLSSVSLSITIIISMLLTNITIAVMSRFAPQFNIFSVGINITLILGLVFVYLTFIMFVNNGETVIQDGLKFLNNILTRTG